MNFFFADFRRSREHADRGVDPQDKAGSTLLVSGSLTKVSVASEYQWACPLLKKGHPDRPVVRRPSARNDRRVARDRRIVHSERVQVVVTRVPQT